MNCQEAEAEFESEVLGESTISRMFEASAVRHENEVAQQYKGVLC